MNRFPEKLRSARKAMDLSQTELAEVIGVTQRSLTNYERGCAIPRQSIMRKIAEALNVTVEYLTNDDTDDPDANRRAEDHINAAREHFGNKGAKEAEELLERNRSFFAAGGEIDQESKDAFFDALMEVYLDSKRRAREKFTSKKKQQTN